VPGVRGPLRFEGTTGPGHVIYTACLIIPFFQAMETKVPLIRQREVYSVTRFNAVSFWMQDRNNVESAVLCKASYEALCDRGKADGDGLSTHAVFERHRERIEKIASAKYEAGDFATGDGDDATIVILTHELTP